jgi:hydrogenase maturation protein HypF
MLPFTPLHLLLLEKETGFPEVLVMTSGNLSEEPIAFEDEDALERLSPLVDGFLTHNRGINIRVDDSVLRVFDGKSFSLRRSRGYAPDPIRLPFEIPEMLACGAELKNTFCLSKANYAFLSHHIGDLENYESLASFTSGIEHYQKLFRVTPRTIIADLHPDYLSTKYATDRAENSQLPLVQVQHHHAHLVACLADNHYFSDEPVIGCIFDGTGYGTDGNIWGGEFLLGAYSDFSRVRYLAPVPLPGGDASIKHPLRIGLSYLHAAGIGFDEALAPYTDSSPEVREAVLAQITKGINAPLTTSMGRLFDAVAAIVGIRQHVSYEAQAAMELEACCDPSITEWYPFEIAEKEINVLLTIRAVVDELKAGTIKSTIAAKFHNTVAHICQHTCHEIRSKYAISTVALSGGVWQNTTLLAKTIALLKADGFKVLIHHQVPINDGGIALGQLMVAAFTRKE